MIKIIGEPGESNCRIRFSPRTGFKKTHETIERELVYGHHCALCTNVVQAFFLTDTPVDLWPYEETAVISLSKYDNNYGTILKVVPNAGSKEGYTNYTSTALQTVRDSAQHIVLKNHVLKYHGLDQEKFSTDQFFEPGERTCERTGVFALREDLLIRDIAVFMKMDRARLNTYDLPPVAEFVKAAATYEFSSLPAYGNVPPIVVFPRTLVSNKWGNEWQLANILKPYQKKEAA